MTEKEKARAYDEAFERAKQIIMDYDYDEHDNVFMEIFPELKESNENIKYSLMQYLWDLWHKDSIPPRPDITTCDKWLDWLERQFKQIHYATDASVGQKATNDSVYVEDVKSAKPKFENGCWITNGRYLKLIVGIGTKGYAPYYYMFKDGTTKYIDEIDKTWHLWTIDDAKDGDVLVAKIHHWEIGGNIDGLPIIVPTIFTYQEVKADNKTIHAYNSLYGNKVLKIDRSMYHINEYGIKDVKPATKEQRDLLFQKMKEAGYEWDAEKKELKKIEQKSWSEEDELMFISTIQGIEMTNGAAQLKIDWLKSLKERIGG